MCFIIYFVLSFCSKDKRAYILVPFLLDIQAYVDKITKHYKTSLSAAEKARNATPIIRTVSKTRKNILTELSNLDKKDKNNLEKLNKMKSLQISKMNEMVRVIITINYF